MGIDHVACLRILRGYVRSCRATIASEPELRHVYHNTINSFYPRKMLHGASPSSSTTLCYLRVRQPHFAPALPSPHITEVSAFTTPVTCLRPVTVPTHDHAQRTQRNHHAPRSFYLRTLYQLSLPRIQGAVHPPSRLPTFSCHLSTFLAISILLHDMRHIRKLKNKVKSKLSEGSDSERVSSSSAPRTSTDLLAIDTRRGKRNSQRDLSSQDPSQSKSTAQTSRLLSADAPLPPPSPLPGSNHGESTSRSSVTPTAASNPHLFVLSSSPTSSGRARELQEPGALVSTAPFSTSTIAADSPDAQPGQLEIVSSPFSAHTVLSAVESGGITVTPSATAAEDGTPPATPTRARSDLRKTALGGLSSLLKIAKEASAPLPPLQAAIGAVVACVDIYTVRDGYP